jgi:hypothetical protein
MEASIRENETRIDCVDDEGGLIGIHWILAGHLQDIESQDDKGVQGTNQPRSDETVRGRKAPLDHGEASTFAAPVVAMLVQRVAGYTLGFLTLGTN